jgi:integrase/recombinase XerD
LATLRAFAHDVALQCPEALLLTQQIQAIPMKRFEKPLLGFLSREEIQALLEAPDEQTWCGYRDRILLTLLYNTGARVSELIAIRVADVELTVSASVRLHGKGRKQRTVPLWKETATPIRQWLVDAHLNPEQPLVPTRRGLPMTRSNVAERIDLAVNSATKQCAQLPITRPKRIAAYTASHDSHALTASWRGHYYHRLMAGS